MRTVRPPGRGKPGPCKTCRARRPGRVRSVLREPASPLGCWNQRHERGAAMRDIRGDLQARASLLEEQTNAQEAQFDQLIEQLKREHDTRLEDFRAELDAVNRLMELQLLRPETAARNQRNQRT